MPTAEEAKAALAAALLNDPATAAIIGRHAYPDQAKQLPPGQPYLVFWEANSKVRKFLSGKSGSRQSIFRIMGMCQTRVQAAALAKALEGLLDGKVNQLFGNLQVKASLIDDDIGNVDENEIPLPGFEFGDRSVAFNLLWTY